jgi:hypothetical protein
LPHAVVIFLNLHPETFHSLLHKFVFSVIVAQGSDKAGFPEYRFSQSKVSKISQGPFLVQHTAREALFSEQSLHSLQDRVGVQV